MKSTPIEKLETSTGLQSLKDRRDTKMLVQAAKFQRLSRHPMNVRIKQGTKNRLKRNSFVHEKNKLIQQHPDLRNHVPKEIPRCRATPPWLGNSRPIFSSTIPNILHKDSQSGPERKAYTSEYLDKCHPKETWIRVYTDGSAEQATRNGGAGVFILYPDGVETSLTFATGIHSTNYKSEAVAIEKAATHIANKQLPPQNIVFLTDASSVVEALKRNRDKELNDLSQAIHKLSENHKVVIQWIPSHCGLYGNEKADALAKEASRSEQTDEATSYEEEKTLIKRKQQELWKRMHPNNDKKDPYYQLTRQEQVIIFRLRTGHNRLRRHLYNKLKIGDTDRCQCGEDIQDTEHILQACSLYNMRRIQTWPTPVEATQKLYGTLEDLRRTAAFITDARLSI